MIGSVLVPCVKLESYDSRVTFFKKRLERQEAAAKAQAAREEGKVAAETASNERLAQVEAARAKAVQGQTDLKAELHKLRGDAEAMKAEATAKEAVIRAEATTAAERAAARCDD